MVVVGVGEGGAEYSTGSSDIDARKQSLYRGEGGGGGVAHRQKMRRSGVGVEGWVRRLT